MDCSQVNHALTLPGIGDLVDGRFRIDRKLGEGGTSTVYEVSHVITDKKFAIKWLLPELALEDAAVDRFIHEARVGGKFAHPHAVQVYDICKASDSFYMLMELLQGESLQTRLDREGRLSLQEACSIVLACADVLCAAHRVGIIHRDLKPANIFLSKEGDQPEVTKLLDFGISTFCSDLQSLSLTATPRGSVIGTPLYMSPEQMLGEPVDPRADIYALGAVLYELVSGQPPFQADCYGELVVKVTVEASATPLEQLAPVDRQFAAVVARAMARRPEDRYATMEELIFALRPYAGPPDTSTVRAIGSPPKPAPVMAREHEATPQQVALQQAVASFDDAAALRPVRRFGRRGWWSGALGLAAALLVIVGAHWLERSNDTVSASSPAPHTVHLGTQQSLAAVQGAEQAAGWERPSPPEVLTGRAAPDYTPASTSHSKRPRRGTSQHEKATTRDADAQTSKTRAEPKPAVSAQPVDELAPSELKPPSRNSPDRVQIRRTDFGAAPSAPLPKASVSRSDF
jgi:tRNA A-37 threonylcarbamoyl transferase component Bud32